jgi:2-iminobutanoate/2-iminopropanoate deaminase
MARTKINPWTYPGSIDAGVLIENPNRILFVNGQCAVSEDGRPLYPGDIRSQALGAIDNIEVVLQEAGMSLTNIVRMNTYVTDVDAYFSEAHESVTERFAHFPHLGSADPVGSAPLDPLVMSMGHWHE